MPAKRPVRPKADARRSHAVRTGKLRAADPFELIRWLARSQPDPRKALAELVQNSLDAAARSIRISRLRKAGIAELRILDDGEGVIPELGREEALHHLATHVGHSRKADLTPAQRRELMMQGKYGIGLLGFWAIGNVLEIRSKVAGQDPMLLRLHEDSPEFEIEHLRGRLPLEGECWTEVVVRRLHPQAFSSLGARRMAEFLGSELRGQLLAHAAQVLVYDGIARGRATKVIEVQPRRFHGERIDLPASVAVPGYGALQIELYLLPVGDEAGKVAVAQAGTVVYDDIADLTLADFARAPWSEPRLGGLLEFADFQVPPGNRRAVVPDAAAAAFVAAVRGIEVLVAECIAAAEAAVGAELEANLFKQLERAFREVPRRAPEYDFFEVLDRRRAGFAPGITSETDAANGEASEAIPADGAAGEVPPGTPVPADQSRATAADEDPALDDALLPMSGPLHAAVIVPPKTRVERFGERKLRVLASDAAGLRISRSLEIAWRVEAGDAVVEANGSGVAMLCVGGTVGEVLVAATVREGDREVTATAQAQIVEATAGTEAPRSGIPEPVLIEEPTEPWRSRMIERRWEVNSGHPDFREAVETPRRKLRYLAALLAKEVVLHSFPAPQLGPALERMVEVLTITERRLERG